MDVTGRYGRSMPAVVVPAARVERWVLNFQERHGDTVLTVVEGVLRGAASDGSTFAARLPFATAYDGSPDAVSFAAEARTCAPTDWGVLLVRKGGFAVARLDGAQMGASKTGQRHVQGRTKAGGQSQQRFARRRDNQARQAYEAAADHAARILEDLRGPVVVGGDRSAVEEVLADRRLAGLTVVDPWLALPDPRRNVLEQGVAEALSVLVDVHNA
ncbi:peptide chain release factor 1 [Nocardioides dokdonensis FR1436]|uniref:Peptide chain release factor 1 n=2 Tax=Nocardioides TaxID=1839 RepID=A0A1A9GNA9_9ACTN|nr:peptide chain release factor 1 [Nocardioides dokdonensis FR1436]